jgi:hypothetical protein
MPIHYTALTAEVNRLNIELDGNIRKFIYLAKIMKV